mgnify:FL=1
MSKLDDITKDPIKQVDIKILILELYADSLRDAGSFENLGDTLRKKVAEL